MIESSQGETLKFDLDESNIIVQEYREIAKCLQQDLNDCKIEQHNIRLHIDVINNENKDAYNAVQDNFAKICSQSKEKEDFDENEMIKNLQERVAIMQMEKDAVLDLWKMSLKSIDMLEEELKIIQIGGKHLKTQDEQIHHIRESYSEVIRALELKLLEAKENFMKHQSSCQCTKKKIEQLTQEKQDIMLKYTILQKEVVENDKKSQQTLESLRMQFEVTKAELEKCVNKNVQLEEKLQKTNKFAADVVAKNEETKYKMAEAIDIVETAVREKDLVLQKEAYFLEEKKKLEYRLEALTDEYTVPLQKEIIKLKDSHEKNIKKYLLEIKELKTESREKATLFDRIQREYQLIQEELDRVRSNSDDSLHKANLKILDLEEKLKHSQSQLEINNQSFKEKISQLEHLLMMSNEELKKIQKQNSKNSEDLLQQMIEKNLAKAWDDKEDLTIELRSLKSAFDRENQKREFEKNLFENKMKDLEVNLQKAAQSHDDRIQSLNPTKAFHLDQGTLNYDVLHKPHCYPFILSDQLNNLQVKFYKKTQELSHHVEVHQNLSKKWREEATSLAEKFQEKSKDMRSKMSALKKENEGLNRELLACRQQIAHYRTQAVQRYELKNDTI